jgi:hypothetical protein
MSDREQPRLMSVGGMLIGPTPQPPGHLLDIDPAAADAAWRQSHGSIAAYHMLLDEHANGTINLLSRNPTRLTGPDAPQIAGGDKRFSATGGEVYGGSEQGQTPVIPLAGGPQPSPQPNADQVSPLSDDERAMLAELRSKSQADDLSAGEAANLKALSDREEALANAKPLARREQTRLTSLRDNASRTPEENAEMAALAARENIER